ncbi:MAG: hypothetical protein AB8G15_07595 [Saprospiraceae bacterium]
MDNISNAAKEKVPIDYFLFPLLKFSFLAMSVLVLRLLVENMYHDFSLRMSMSNTNVTHCVVHYHPYSPHLYLLIFPMFLLAISLVVKRGRLPSQTFGKILIFSPILLFFLHLLLTYLVDS